VRGAMVAYFPRAIYYAGSGKIYRCGKQDRPAAARGPDLRRPVPDRCSLGSRISRLMEFSVIDRDACGGASSRNERYALGPKLSGMLDARLRPAWLRA